MFGIGNVLATTVRTWGRNFPRLFVVMLVFHLVPLVGWQLLHWFEATRDVLDAYYYRPLYNLDLHPALSDVAAGGGWIASAFLTAASSLLVVARLRDERAGLGAAIVGAVRRPFSLFAGALIVRVVTTGVIVVGVMLVWDRYEWRHGGVVTFVAWVVAWVVLKSLVIGVLPALVVERRGPVSAVRRGIALCSGNRIKVLAIVLVAHVLYTGVHLGIYQLVMIDPGGDFDAYRRRLELIGYITIGVSALLASLWSTGEAVVYERLRAAKEGPSANQLDRVFE